MGSINSFKASYSTHVNNKPAVPTISGQILQIQDDGTVIIRFQSKSETDLAALRDWLLTLSPQS